jgi:hypothetical protein
LRLLCNHLHDIAKHNYTRLSHTANCRLATPL